MMFLLSCDFLYFFFLLARKLSLFTIFGKENQKNFLPEGRLQDPDPFPVGLKGRNGCPAKVIKTLISPVNLSNETDKFCRKCHLGKEIMWPGFPFFFCPEFENKDSNLMGLRLKKALL